MHVAVLGARSFGRHHLRGLENSPHVEAVTAVGRDRAALETLRDEFPKVRHLASDPIEAATDPGVDVVDIILPHHMHLDVAAAAFAAGKHVITEKPPARTMAEFNAMQRAAVQADRRLFVIMNQLWNTVNHAARESLDRGDIGEPFLAMDIGVGNSRGIYEDPHNWRADRERCGGGLLIDGGFHTIYRLLFLLEKFGMPRSVIADRAQIAVDLPDQGEDFISATLAYDSGLRVHLMRSWTTPHPLAGGPVCASVLGSEGSLTLPGGAGPLLLKTASGEHSIDPPEGPRDFGSLIPPCVEHYIDCIATGAEPMFGVDLAGLTLEVIEAIYRSGDSGRRVDIHGSFQTRL